ncbi:Glycosyltransferase, GlcNAc [Plasmopara halstedii]|uniref:Glycosyltransferase, GlcNAc n=1 Tax=Plasmopara halstedii TaxID=4781 RepID=A0A0N7L828_PLAHL|nr:Glycosyltransferase, GlcNAc [Plasmopara halstedii]CEG48715.1 Glycosyltransferase, GlcNAc [Plasmopara halstedii]|eukprot:XP_024585084.1 Glycosyltransferase, GlcNAc [Plasmopara halstedii]
MSTLTLPNSRETRVLDPSVQHIPLEPYDKNLRPPPANIPSSFEIHIGTSVFRDGIRCGYTLFTAFKRAKYPERLRFGIVEQILDSDFKCLDEYCKLALVEWPDYSQCRYQEHVQVDVRPAAETRGCTTARHRQKKLIGKEEFCLQVDGHSIFTNGWDEALITEWKRIDNEMAILTVYPHDLHDFIKENGDNNPPHWIPHMCTTYKGGNGLTRLGGANNKRNANFPQLDPYTPWLWDGEEFLRSIDYWTHGYDLYSPSKLGNVLYHNYTKKPNSFWESPVDQKVKALDMERTHNRVRLRLGLGFIGQVNAMELDKYAFGTARTFKQYLHFANVTLTGFMNETNSCKQLHWVPYTNSTEVEIIVGNGWKMIAPAPTPAQPAAGVQGSHNVDAQGQEAHELAESGEGAEHGGRGEGEDLATLHTMSKESKDRERLAIRQGKSSNRRHPGITAAVWGVLAVVLIALFAALSNDRIAYAIRRSCFSTAPHHSRD